MKKAQASIEMMFSIGIIVLVFLGLTYFTFDRRIDIQDTEKIIDDKIECHKLSNIISMAYITQSNHTLALEKNATIIITSQLVQSGKNYYPCTMPISRITGPTGNIIELIKGDIHVGYLQGQDLVEVKNA